MDNSVCEINHLEENILLPPRKRLLAGLKRQNSSAKSYVPEISSSLPEFNTSINNTLSSHSKNLDLLDEEAVETSKSAALAAFKVAEAARVAAEEKAVIAVKAIAAAKSALELVASFDDENVLKTRRPKKNAVKKSVLGKESSIKKHITDEELARELHRDMNSSPRISYNGSVLEQNVCKIKKAKILNIDEKIRVPNGEILLERSLFSSCNGSSSDVYIQDGVCKLKIDQNSLKMKQTDEFDMGNGRTESGNLKEKNMEAFDDACTTGRKRGPVKPKKLPLSICASRDQSNPREDAKFIGSTLTDERRGNTTVNDSMHLFPMQPSVDGMISAEPTPVWKCKDLNAPESLKRQKIVQSRCS